MKEITFCKVLTSLIALFPPIYFIMCNSKLAVMIPIHFNLRGEADIMVAKSSVNVYLLVSMSVIMYVGYTILIRIILSFLANNNFKKTVPLKKCLTMYC